MTRNVVLFDERLSGLPCRCSCGLVFRVCHTDTVADLQNAGRARDLHELQAHNYVHEAIATYATYHNFGRRRH